MKREIDLLMFFGAKYGVRDGVEKISHGFGGHSCYEGVSGGMRKRHFMYRE